MSCFSTWCKVKPNFLHFVYIFKAAVRYKAPSLSLKDSDGPSHHSISVTLIIFTASVGKISFNLQERKMSKKATQWFRKVLPTVEQDDGHSDSYKIPPAVISLKNTDISAHCAHVDVSCTPALRQMWGFPPLPTLVATASLHQQPLPFCSSSTSMALVGQFRYVSIHEAHGDSHWECWKILISLPAEEWPWRALPGTTSQ